MKKLLAILLVLALMPCLALADEDLSSLSTDELLALRTSIDREIASRSGTADEQTIDVDGVLYRFLLAEVGTARNDSRGLGIILLASNTSESSKKIINDLRVTVTHGGVPLDTSWVESEHFTGDSVSTSLTAVIRPGAVDMYVYLGFILNGEGGRVEIVLSRMRPRAGEDPYCGAFVVDLPELR